MSAPPAMSWSSTERRHEQKVAEAVQGRVSEVVGSRRVAAGGKQLAHNARTCPKGVRVVMQRRAPARVARRGHAHARVEEEPQRRHVGAHGLHEHVRGREPVFVERLGVRARAQQQLYNVRIHLKARAVHVQRRLARLAANIHVCARLHEQLDYVQARAAVHAVCVQVRVQAARDRALAAHARAALDEPAHERYVYVRVARVQVHGREPADLLGVDVCAGVQQRVYDVQVLFAAGLQVRVQRRAQVRAPVVHVRAELKVPVHVLDGHVRGRRQKPVQGRLLEFSNVRVFVVAFVAVVVFHGC
ncbi:PP13 [Orf virus]|uniref:PP13 n=1 Tax=Orf virus TaxID=10258 RepID=F1AXH1_ORFV|nr:PP13 [Orf virus]